MDKIEVFIADLNLSDDMRQKIADAEQLPKGVTVVNLIEDHDANTNAAYRDVLAQDSEFTKGFAEEASKKTRGEILGTLDNQLKAAGFTGEFEDDRGRIPYSKIFSSFRSQIEKATGETPNEAIAELQEKLSALNTQIDAGTHPKFQEINQELELKSGELSALLAGQARAKNLNYLKSLLPAQEKLNISRDDAASLLALHFDEHYKWGSGDESPFEIREKDGKFPQIGNQVLKEPSKVVGHVIEQKGSWLKASNGELEKKKTTVEIQDGKAKVHPNALKRADEMANR